MALPNKKTPFDVNISSKKLNKELNFIFDRGWSPILVPILQSHSVYLKIQDWVGGEGEKPYDTTVYTYYLGPTGLVTDINDAVDIAVSFITSDWLSHIIEKSSVIFTLIETGSDINLHVDYTDLNGNDGIYNVVILTKDEISDNDINNSVIYGATRTAIAKSLKTLREYLIIDNYLSIPWSHEQALSQNATMTAIDKAKAKFDVPILDLTTSLIQQVEQTDGLTNTNPYYMLINEDNREGGRHTITCPIVCINKCCDLNDDGGYEERGNREGIKGCRCTAGVEEVLSVCKITVTTLGNVGDRYDYDLNGLPYTFYVVKSGDTINDVISGLIANLPNTCTTGRNCNVINVTNNSFELIALAGSGSTPNSWIKSVSTSGIAEGTFIQITNGIDFLPTTYRGVKHHLIAYDGISWYDFGNSLSFGNNSENNECECTFIHMTDTPNSYVNYKGFIPIVNNDEKALEWIDYTLLNLHDTPTLYTANNRLKINTQADAVEFVNDTITELEDVDNTYTSNQKLKTDTNGTNINFIDDTFISINDTPVTYTGNADKFVRVNTSETMLIFSDAIVMGNNGLSLYSDNKTLQLGGILIKDTTIDGDNFNYNFTFSFLKAMDITVDTFLTINADDAVVINSDMNITDNNILSTNTIRPYSTGLNIDIPNTVPDNSILITDNRDSGKRSGIEYADDYSTDFVDNTLITKKYTNTHINGKPTSNIDSLNGNTGPGNIEDGYTLNWDDTLKEYILIAPLTIPVYTANNGLSLNNNNIKLGGTLIENTIIDTQDYDFNINSPYSIISLSTDDGSELSLKGAYLTITGGNLKIIDNSTTPIGIKYNSDYSANFVDRSLVDKGYTDSNFIFKNDMLPSSSNITLVNNWTGTITVTKVGRVYTINGKINGNGASDDIIATHVYPSPFDHLPTTKMTVLYTNQSVSSSVDITLEFISTGYYEIKCTGRDTTDYIFNYTFIS